MLEKRNKVRKLLITTIVSSLSITAMIQLSYAKELSQWQSDSVYWGGDEIQYNGQAYRAKWWTKGDIPNKDVVNAWDTPWELKSTNNNASNPGDNNNTSQPEKPDNNSSVVYPDYSNVDVGQGIKWPESVFAPFVDATAWPPFPLAEKTKELKVPYYNLGFIVSQSKDVCKPTWGTYYSAEEGPLNEEIKKVRAMGGDVMVSFGGAANVPLHVSAPDVESLKEQYKRFIKAYGLTRIDFDIEGTWVNDIDSLKRNSKALRTLQDELKSENYDLEIWFTLPVLPSGLTNDGINLIKLALDEDVDIAGVNVMTMDYGDSAAPNPNNQMGEYGIEAISNLKNQLEKLYNDYNTPKTDDQLWGMIGTTPMIGLNDVTTETFNQQDARETLEFAKRKQVGMISMWSINRDKSPNGALGYVSTSASSIIQEEYEFAQIFNAYNDISILDISNNGSSDGEKEDGNSEENQGVSGDTWDSASTYTQGNRVTYKGHIYEAKWWTRGDDPSKEVNNEWETPWKLIK
ncbi:glycosyl hydrolase family 18 protein [Wukongibacter baidiensis]|uniref:carbohydrate-binding protein n=1 Tax=Wukongibacter baidiensis TaxID=1723361 RepID=UPI003D7FBF46